MIVHGSNTGCARANSVCDFIRASVSVIASPAVPTFHGLNTRSVFGAYSTADQSPLKWTARPSISSHAAALFVRELEAERRVRLVHATFVTPFPPLLDQPRQHRRPAFVSGRSG